jgi:hypothetical protein
MEDALPLRAYLGGDGRLWTVWNVMPKFSPVRSGGDRRLEARAVHWERRVSRSDRRGAEPAPEWLKGWLCFQTVTEKRRLAPVPDRWEVCSTDELEEYRAKAAVIRR